MSQQWFGGNYADRYGGSFLSSQGQSPAAAGGMSELPKIGASPTATPYDAVRPGSGLFFFGVLAAVSFGLMAVSTTVRVGPAKASVSAGKT